MLAHPFFMSTRDDGAYELPRLPPGNYTIEFWHHTLGIKRATVKIEADAKHLELNVTYDDSDLPKPGMRKKLPRKSGQLGWKISN